MAANQLVVKAWKGVTADIPTASMAESGKLFFYVDTSASTHLVQVCRKVAGVPTWQDLAIASEVVSTATLTTRGDLLVRGSSAPERLALGASGYVLTSNGTDAAWAAPLSATLTTRGDLFVRGASAPERLALGASGYVLTSNGTDAVWAAASGVALSSTAPVALGSASAGAGATAARTDHVHPTTGLALLAAENTFTQRQLFDGGALVNAGQVLTFQTGSNSIAINQGAHTFASARTVYFPDASGEIDVTGAAQTATARKTFAAGLVPFVGTVAEIGAIGSPTVGLLAFATDGRVGAEGAGLGTGCPVYYGAGQWRRFEDGAAVAA